MSPAVSSTVIVTSTTSSSSSSTRSPSSSPLFKPKGVFSRLRSAFGGGAGNSSSSSSSSSNTNTSNTSSSSSSDHVAASLSPPDGAPARRSVSAGRDRSATTTLSAAPPSRTSRLHNLRAYSNGNASSVDLSITHSAPSPQYASRSPNPAFSPSASTSAASASSPSSAQNVVISPSPSDSFLYANSGTGQLYGARLSPLSSPHSQRSPLSASYSPSSASEPLERQQEQQSRPLQQRQLSSSSLKQSTLDNGPFARHAPQPESASLPTPPLPALKTHRKSTKSTATLPGWLLSSFGAGGSSSSKSSKGTANSGGVPDSPRTPMTSLSAQTLPVLDNEVTPKQRKRRTRNDDLLKGSGDHSLLATSRRAFSKSLDDLSMLAKGNISPAAPTTTSAAGRPSTSETGHQVAAGPRSRKSMDDKRRRRESMREVLRGSVYFTPDEHERHAIPSLPGRNEHGQIQLPPSLTLPGGLRIENTAQILGENGSMDVKLAGSLAPAFDPVAANSAHDNSTPPSSAPSQVPSLDPIRPQSRLRQCQGPAHQRDSQIVLFEGLVKRKADYKSHKKTASRGFPFYSSVSSSSGGRSPRSPGGQMLLAPPDAKDIDLSRGWKPYYAVLRGTKLHLYKIPLELMAAVKLAFASITPASDTITPTEVGRLQDAISQAPHSAYSLSIANSKIRELPSAQRAYVFEVQTEEGEVAILQTTSASLVERWISVLEEVGETIASRRASYLETLSTAAVIINEHAQPSSPSSSSPKRWASGNAMGVFGARLDDLVRREGGPLPAIVVRLLEAIEDHGLAETGIYRISGENKVVQAMKAAADVGRDINIDKNSESGDAHNLASCLKLWLRELPEVIPSRFYKALIDTSSVDEYADRLYRIRDLVWQLPKPHFDLLQRLCQHLHLVSENEFENHMHSKNLAIVFAPTLLKPHESPDSYGILMSNLGAAVKLIATLIEQSAWIFSYSDEAEEEKATQEEEDDDQALELPDQLEGELEIFHEAETSIYETAP